MSHVDPKYMIPCWRTVTGRVIGALDDLKLQRRQALEEAVDGGNVIHSIRDLWSSHRSIWNIAGIRFQYFDKQFNLKVVNATYRHFGKHHTGTDRVPIFEDCILLLFGISMKAAGYQVINNAKNVISAFSIFSLRVSSLTPKDESSVVY